MQWTFDQHRKELYNRLSSMVDSSKQRYNVGNATELPDYEKKWLRQHQEMINKGLDFIKKLNENGVPLKSINVNDWFDSGIPKIYIETPYPYHTTKVYERWSEREIDNGIKFYKENQKVNKNYKKKMLKA